MAELKQTYCSCYTAVRSSKKKSCWRILDFITKQSANRLQLHQLTEEIRRWTHRNSMVVLEGAEGLEHCGERLFKTFDQPHSRSSSDLHFTSEPSSVCEHMLASHVLAVFVVHMFVQSSPLSLF